jgi:hypothetical protein
VAVETTNKKEATELLTVEQKRARIKKEISEQVVEPSNFPPFSIGDLYGKQFTEQEWLVDGLVPTEAVTILSAAPGSLKTRTTLHLAVKASKGEPLFGEFPTRQSGFLIIDEESGERLLQKQLKQLGATEDLPIYYRSFQNFKLNKTNVDLIKTDCQTYELKTIVFDSLIQMHTANENDAAEMAPVMNFLKQLAEDGYTVLVIAHDRKTGQFGRRGNSELRGSSAILGGVDAHISLLKRKDSLLIEPTKLRHAMLHKPFEVRVTGDDDHCTFEYLGESKPGDNSALKLSIVNYLVDRNEPLNQQDLLAGLKASGIKIGETKLRNILNEMLADEEMDSKPGNGKEILYFPR